MDFPCAALQAGLLLVFCSSFLLRPQPRINQLPEAPFNMVLFEWGNRYLSHADVHQTSPAFSTHEGILSFLASGFSLLLNASLPWNLPYCLNPNQ